MHWTLRFGDGRLPFWVFDPARRVPGTAARDYLPLAQLLWPGSGKTVGETISCKGPLYERLIEPLFLAALNIDPPEGSAKLAAALIRETLAAGGRACRPLIARDGLAATLIEPALEYLRQRGVLIRLEHQLRAMQFGAARVEALDFGGEVIALAEADAVVLAVPPYAAASHRPAGRPAADPRRAQCHDAMDLRFSRPAVGYGERRRQPARFSARATGANNMVGRSSSMRGHVGPVAKRSAGMADRARTPRHFRRNNRARAKAPGCADRVAQPRCRRRLDQYRLAGNH